MSVDHEDKYRDDRTDAEVIRAWKKLNKIKRTLIREGRIDATASPAQIIQVLRQLIAPHLL
jgi:hypothetical protein